MHKRVANTGYTRMSAGPLFWCYETTPIKKSKIKIKSMQHLCAAGARANSRTVQHKKQRCQMNVKIDTFCCMKLTLTQQKQKETKKSMISHKAPLIHQV